MDFDSSAKFVASLAKFLQSLCNGYVDFDKGVEVIGHIHINVDSDLGKKVDYVLNERVCKNDNSITFISNSFPAQPAEKPQPPPKAPESDNNDNEHRVVMDDSGQLGPNSTNVGTMGPYAAVSRGNAGDGVYSPGTKRPRSPLQGRNMGAAGSPSVGKHAVHRSPRYHDSGGPQAKYGRANAPLSSVSSDYDGANVFQSGGDEDDYSSNYGDQNVSEVDQKPVIDPDIDIVKEEYVANQQSSCAYGGGNQTPGSGRGRGHSTPQYPGPIMNQTPANYSSASSQQSDIYTGSSFEGAGDPSTLTRAQQEELEMYYRKGTDQHLTFLRNMREAHAMYPFTGKRDKELFEKALQELLKRLPLLRCNMRWTVESLARRGHDKKYTMSSKLKNLVGQFKSPGQGGRGGHQYGRQGYAGHPHQQQYYSQGGPGSYPGTPQPGGQYMGGMERRMSSAGSEGGDSFLQAPGEESYDYQPGASDDSQGTQQSVGDTSGQGAQAGFHGAFSNGSQGGQQSQSQPVDTKVGIGPGPDPPDIKQEANPMPFMSSSEFELIEIDPDDEDDM